MEEKKEVETHRTPKEQAAFSIRDYWQQMQDLMNNIVMPLVEQSKYVTNEMREDFGNIHSSLHAALYTLRPPYKPKPATPAELARQEEVALARKATRNEKSDVQKCVDEWLKEQIDEYDLNPALLEDTDTESFDYKCSETCDETRSGEVSFEVPDRVKERLDEAMEKDFNDELKEYLDERHYVDFTVDMEEYESGEMTESSTELT